MSQPDRFEREAQARDAALCKAEMERALRGGMGVEAQRVAEEVVSNVAPGTSEETIHRAVRQAVKSVPHVYSLDDYEPVCGRGKTERSERR